MNNSKFAIEALVNGQWAREHAGAVDETTLFSTREEAEEAANNLAYEWGCDESGVRVVEVARNAV